MYYREKIKFRIIGIIAILVIVWSILFIIDYLRVSNDTSPIFCISIGASFDDGGSNELYGLFYKVNKYVYMKDGTVKYEIGTWFMNFEKPPHDVNIYNENINIYKELEL